MSTASTLRWSTDISAARRAWAIGKPCVWLLIGLLASYFYMYGPAFFFPNVVGIPPLPVPLFPPQAIMLAVRTAVAPTVVAGPSER